MLAFQIAGADGLRLLHADGLDAERESAPAENLLVELLAIPGQQGLATLILIDEVLMYAREKVGLDPAWRSRLVNFFQYLTQAATKIDRCAIVASLLASEPRKSDTLGKEIAQELFTIFRREREEGIQPVLKEDVAEVLRRRFFTPDSIRDREAFRPHVVAALKGVTDHDEPTAKDGKAAEERIPQELPVPPRPDRGPLHQVDPARRLPADAGHPADVRPGAAGRRPPGTSRPLIGANVFLNEPGKVEVSPAARELTNVAGSEEYEGKKQEWTGILEGELAKARDIQAETSGLGFREVEQAVFATFLHSQPVGQKAALRDLTVLLGPTRPDKIQLEKALRRWTELSWFLDEGAISDVPAAVDGRTPLPKSWRLGSKPNLTQMHHDARTRVSPELIEAEADQEHRDAQEPHGGHGGRRLQDQGPQPAREAERRHRRRRLPLRRARAEGGVDLGQPERRGAAVPRRDDRPGPPPRPPQRRGPGGAVAGGAGGRPRSHPRLPGLGGGPVAVEGPGRRPGPPRDAGRQPGGGEEEGPRGGPAGVQHRRHRLRGERGPGVQADPRHLEPALRADQGGHPVAHPGDGRQLRGPAARGALRPLAVGRDGAAG